MTPAQRIAKVLSRYQYHPLNGTREKLYPSTWGRLRIELKAELGLSVFMLFRPATLLLISDGRRRYVLQWVWGTMRIVPVSRAAKRTEANNDKMVS